MDNKFYAYLHRAADTGDVFYVGKGYGDRDKSKSGRSNWWRNVVAKHGLLIERVRENISEDESLALEIELIALYGRRCDGGTLVNMTMGGEGVSGFKQSSASIEKMKASKRVTLDTTDYKDRISAALKRLWASPEYRAAQVAAQRSNRPPKKVRRITKNDDELKRVMSENAKRQWASSGYRERMSKVLRGRTRDPEVSKTVAEKLRGRKRPQEAIEATASKNRGRKNSQETIEAMKARRKALWADPVKKAEMLLKRKKTMEENRSSVCL